MPQRGIQCKNFQVILIFIVMLYLSVLERYYIKDLV